MRLPREKPLVYFISDGSITNKNYSAKSAEFLELVRTAVEFHIPLIQLREKNISARNLFELTKAALRAAKNSQTQILVNDRTDIAIAADADGVHLTSRSISAGIVRRFVRSDFLIGVSTHCVRELETAKTAGADFAVFGPVFETSGKADPIGLVNLKAVAGSEPGFPVLALGGVNGSNYREVLAVGAAGFAAIRFLNNSQNLEKLCEELEL